MDIPYNQPMKLQPRKLEYLVPFSVLGQEERDINDVDTGMLAPVKFSRVSNYPLVMHADSPHSILEGFVSDKLFISLEVVGSKWMLTLADEASSMERFEMDYDVHLRRMHLKSVMTKDIYGFDGGSVELTLFANGDVSFPIGESGQTTLSTLLDKVLKSQGYGMAGHYMDNYTFISVLGCIASEDTADFIPTYGMLSDLQGIVRMTSERAEQSPLTYIPKTTRHNDSLFSDSIRLKEILYTNIDLHDENAVYHAEGLLYPRSFISIDLKKSIWTISFMFSKEKMNTVLLTYQPLKNNFKIIERQENNGIVAEFNKSSLEVPLKREYGKTIPIRDVALVALSVLLDSQSVIFNDIFNTPKNFPGAEPYIFPTLNASFWEIFNIIKTIEERN